MLNDWDGIYWFCYDRGAMQKVEDFPPRSWFDLSVDPVKVITVRTTAFDAVATGGAAAVESLTAAADTGEANRAMLQLATDAESAVRGFRLTGRTEFLAPYERGVRLYPVELLRARTGFDAWLFGPWLGASQDLSRELSRAVGVSVRSRICCRSTGSATRRSRRSAPTSP